MKTPSVQIRKGLIVLADDDDDVREILAQRFERAGYDVETAANGVELLEILERVQPTAIFVDLLMPGILGTSILAIVSDDPRLRSVPIALVTGSPELAPLDATVFRKPARFDELLQFVEEPGRHAVIMRLARTSTATAARAKGPR